MSLIPEFVFQTTIARGIGTLRDDSRFIDQLFRNLSAGDQQQMRSFLKDNQIELVINYPRSPLSTPAIVLLLKSETETHAYLGDSMGVETPDVFGWDGEVLPEVLGGAASTSDISGPGPVIFGPHKVLSATNNTIRVSDKTFVANSFITGVGGRTLHIVVGTGSGQQREIVANGGNSIMVSPNWTTIPDDTSVFEVRGVPEETLGEPAKLYDRRDPSLVLERRGSLYTNKYQAQLVGSNQEQTIYLYVILKAIFTLARTFMEGQGIINLRMSGTDFANRPEYIPDYAYMRILNLEFEHPFDVFEEFGNLADQFTLALCDGVTATDSKISGANVTLGVDTPVVAGP